MITRRLTAAIWLLFGATAGAAPDADPDYLWFGTFNGLVRFDGVRFDVFDTANTPPLPSAEIVSLHLDRRGRLWVSTPMGMACVKDGVWKVLRHGQGWSGNYARFFAEHADGRLYVGTFDDKLLELSGDRQGTIAIELSTPEPSTWRLRVSDDGVGWPAGLDFRNTRTMGLQLVVTLTEQLGGTIERVRGPGTAFVVVFPEARDKARV